MLLVFREIIAVCCQQHTGGATTGGARCVPASYGDDQWHGEDSDSGTGLLRCDAVLLDVQFPTFREIARVKQYRNPEDLRITFLITVGNCRPNSTASQPDDTEHCPQQPQSRPISTTVLTPLTAPLPSANRAIRRT
jgi:hypothetical protein